MAFHNGGWTLSFNQDTAVCQKHWNDRLPLLSIIREAQYVLALALWSSLFNLSSSWLSLHPGNPAVTTEECTQKLMFTYMSPHPHRQITPHHVLSNTSLYKRKLSENICALHCSQTQSRLTKGGWKKEKQYSTAAFLTKSELRCDCLCLLLLLPLEELPITMEKRSQRKEKKKEKKKTFPLPVPSHPAQPDFSPSSVHFLNKPRDSNVGWSGRGVSQMQFLIIKRQG